MNFDIEKKMLSQSLLGLVCATVLLGVTVDGMQDINDITDHSDTWVVIVGASRFWYNYRWVCVFFSLSSPCLRRQ